MDDTIVLSDYEFPELNLDSHNNFRESLIKKCLNDSNYAYQRITNNYSHNSSDDNEYLLKKIDKNIKRKGNSNFNTSRKISNIEESKQCIKQREEITKQKVMKQLNLKNRLNNNPKYNFKLIEIVFDEKVKNHDFFIPFLKYNQEHDIKYNVQLELIPNSITFNRNIENHYVNEKNDLCSNIQTVNENHVIIIWNIEETVKHIFNNTFISTVSNIKLLIHNKKKLFLIIYKMNNYFKYLKSIRNRVVQEEVLKDLSNKKQKKSKLKGDKNFANYPIISRKEFDKCLVEIQLMHNVSSKLIENIDEMILWIHQYIKSLALLPVKLDKKFSLSQIDWYINCDNRDTVKVDKNGNGLKRLWLQQLCQFTLMSLETSEAISSIYKSPLQLIEAYKNCSQSAGETLLKDIPIRRAAGPLTSVRKIGPELSKKIYIMFTSMNGEISLND